MSQIDLENVHLDVESTRTLQSLSTVKGKCEYYHYRCDGFNDIGWGCGYRTLQTLCSWIRRTQLSQNLGTQIAQVPSLIQIQEILVKCEDKRSRFINSREWIGCFEASIVLDYLYNVPCKILHIEANSLDKCVKSLREHFDVFGSPVMMGGDLDNGSKGIFGLGLAENNNCDRPNASLLVVDPHYYANSCDENTATNKFQLIKSKWIEWKEISLFNQTNSFYNFCLPQIRYN